jgi:hypothetical protein
VLEVRLANADSRLHVARKTKAHDEWDHTIRMAQAHRATSSLMTDVTPSQASTSCDRVRTHRARKKYGLVPRRLLVSCTQLDKLERARLSRPRPAREPSR